MIDPIARGRAAWPTLGEVDAASFRAYLDARGDAETLPVEDLMLAYACGHGDPVALQLFEAHYMREVAIAAAKLRAAPGVLDEARQVMRDLLFVGGKISTYSGRGDLRGWVRVVAMREVMRLCDRDRREVTIGDEALLDALSPAEDPELEHFKQRYRGELAIAFEQAVAALTPRERTLLRHQVIDGMGVEAIGRLYDVHHSTAARWLVRARDALLAGTHERLRMNLQLSVPEVESVLRLIRSRIDVSVERLLKK